jgi:hypothetical protein
LEFLALRWAVTKKFHDYLFGAKFTVTTDNNPLSYVLTTAKLDATGHRWLAELSTYDFDIRYKPGVKNTDADVLSRLPRENVISSESVSALCHGLTVSVAAPLEIISMSQDVVDGFTMVEGSHDVIWKDVQKDDETRGKVISTS